jgi:hypothetical protein
MSAEMLCHRTMLHDTTMLCCAKTTMYCDVALMQVQVRVRVHANMLLLLLLLLLLLQLLLLLLPS